MVHNENRKQKMNFQKLKTKKNSKNLEKMENNSPLVLKLVSKFQLAHGKGKGNTMLTKQQQYEKSNNNIEKSTKVGPIGT